MTTGSLMDLHRLDHAGSAHSLSGTAKMPPNKPMCLFVVHRGKFVPSAHPPRPGGRTRCSSQPKRLDIGPHHD